MNRTKIEYADYTWNPITGCLHGCPYCYARRMAFRLKGRCGYPSDEPFRPTFHKDRLDEPSLVGKSSVILVVSMGDLLGSWVSRDWISEVIEAMSDARQHTFLVLTKNPGRYAEFWWPSNAWLGTSVETLGKGIGRYKALLAATRKAPNGTWLSVEPIGGPCAAMISSIGWVAVGAETGAGAKKRPSPSMIEKWVEDILKAGAMNDIPVFLKDNLKFPLKSEERPF